MPLHVTPGVVPRAILLSSVALTHALFWGMGLATPGAYAPLRQLIAEGFSTSALVLLSCNLILATRAPVLERFLGGLDKLFVTHRLNGLTVGVLVLTHFSIIPQSVGWVPSKPVAFTTISVLLTAIFVASAPRFPWRKLVPLKYQTWKATHRFMGFVVAGAVTHSLLAPTFVKRVPVLAGWVYTVATLGLLAYAYRELLFSRFGPFRTASVAAARGKAGEVMEVTLAADGGPYLRKPGQFAIASFAEGPSKEQHPFTISSGPGADVRFSIHASGDFTRDIQRGVPAGSAVRLEGPYGRFDYRRGRRRQLWLAGGIGITPFLAMAADLDADREVVLHWSVRTRDEAAYIAELEAAAAVRPGLTVMVHPTRELGHADLRALGLVPAPRETTAFVCGPVPMRQEMVRQLLALGVPREEIYFEEFRLR